VVLDVFEKHPLRFRFPHDPRDVRPQVPLVPRSALPPGDREGLAGIASSDAMNDATPRAAVEGAQIRPDRSFIQE
jgi:hypothetical protein